MAPEMQPDRAPSKAPDRATVRRALKSLQKILKRHPEDIRSMVRVARAHRLLGEPERAARWYRVAVHELSHRGMGLKALALSKEMLAVAPEDHELLLEMARLYAKHPGATGDHTGRVAIPLEQGTVVGRIPRDFTATSVKALQILDDPAEVDRLQPPKTAKPPPPPPPEAFADDDSALEKVEEQLTTLEHERPERRERAKAALEKAHLGEVPLLSGLGKGAFVTLLKQMKRVDLDDGDLLFDEGETAHSFFIVADGEVEVTSRRGGEQTTIATLGEGEVVGVLGLYSGRRRNATVAAHGKTVVFEVTDKVLAKVVRDHPASKKAIAAFYRQRLLETFFGTAPGFCELDRSVRLEIVDRFRQKHFEPRDLVVSPGEVTSGIWLVVRGEVVLSTREGGKTVIHGRLTRGQVFGCVSAVTGMPSNGSAECTEKTVLASLSQRAYAEVVKTHPELRDVPGQLAKAGALVARTFFVGDTGASGARS